MAKKVIELVVGLLVLSSIAAAVYGNNKQLPAGVSVMGEEHMVPAESVGFFVDRTYVDDEEVRFSEQEIFDEVMRMIARAEKYILVDMFLYNDFQGDPPELTRDLANELTDALVARKQEMPDIEITVVSDPLNEVYGGYESPHFRKLEEVGINVVVTDLLPLRDSNPIYSGVWRVLGQWWRNSIEGGRLPNVFDARQPRVTLRSYLWLANFKANHRKLVVADEGGKMATLVTSANPHGGSSAHSNVAIKVDDKLWREVIASEQAVGQWSKDKVTGYDGEVRDEDGEVKVQLLTEGAIRERLVDLLRQAGSGDSIDVAMFYLSERQVVENLIAASDREAKIRLVLDPNKDAFGRTKNGVPNRPVAHELQVKTGGDVQIRWCDTHGEQCHTKMVLVHMGKSTAMLLGSANLTRRNIGDYNLETNVLVIGDRDVAALKEARNYFEEIWSNQGGRKYSTSYAKYADDSWQKRWMYRVQEATGLSSF